MRTGTDMAGIRGHRPAASVRPAFALLAAAFAICLALVLAAGPSGAAPLDDWTLRADLAPVCVMDLDTGPGAGSCAASPADLAAAPAAVPDMLSAVLPGFDALLPQAIGSATARFSETVAPIPLPAAGWMLIAGLGALGLWGKRRDGRVVPLRATLRASVRSDPGLRPGPVRLPGFTPFSDLLLDRSAGGRIPHAFAPGRSSPLRPVGGAGHRYAATAERAPPAAAAFVDTPVVADSAESGAFLPRLLGRPIGLAARLFACLRPMIRDEAPSGHDNQNGPITPASAAEGPQGRRHPAWGAPPVPVDRTADEQSLLNQFTSSGVPSMFLTKKRGGLAAAALVAAFGLAAPASAVTLADLGDPITTTVPDGQSVSTGWVFAGTFGGNDCAGELGANFADCEFEDSPIIAKIDYNDDGSVKKTEVNTGEFPGFDLGWITVTGSDGSSGTWEYDPGPDGPGITAFVAKGGNYFNLFYTVDFEPFFGGSAVNWFTPKQCGGGPNGSNSPNFCGLSHLSFYDSEGGTPKIPLPAAAWLMLAGIGGLGAVALRRKAA
jgi:hypothetical protein